LVAFFLRGPTDVF
jgi:ferric-chelate reductase